MEQVWQFAGSAKENEAFEIKGVDVWSQGWQVINGEEAHVYDPVYGKTYIFKVFCMQDGNQKIEFAGRLGILHKRLNVSIRVYNHMNRLCQRTHDLFLTSIHSELNTS